MGNSEALTALLEPVVAGLGYELVGLEHLQGRGAGMLRIYIDHPAGITLEDCERVSRQVSAVLDVEDPIAGAYRLEVSSPGVDRPLFTPAQFASHRGERVRVQLRRLVAGRRRLTGSLVSVEESGIGVEEAGQLHEVSFEDIERAHLAPEHTRAGGPRRVAT